jgi:hypothetical protein
MVFGFDLPACLEQAAKVIGAFGYDGIELAGFYDHATIERFPDKRSRRRLVADLEALSLQPRSGGNRADVGHKSTHFTKPSTVGRHLDVADKTIRRAARRHPGRRSSLANGSARLGTGLSNRWKPVRRTVQCRAAGRASSSCQYVPGKRTRRSLTDSPRFSKFLAGECWCVIAWARIGLNTPSGYASPDFAPQPPQLGLQAIQLGTRNADHFGCLDAHAWLPSLSEWS